MGRRKSFISNSSNESSHKENKTKFSFAGLHESLVGTILIGLVGEVGHINLSEAGTVLNDNVTHSKVHHV